MTKRKINLDQILLGILPRFKKTYFDSYVPKEWWVLSPRILASGWKNRTPEQIYTALFNAANSNTLTVDIVLDYLGKSWVYSMCHSCHEYTLIGIWYDGEYENEYGQSFLCNNCIKELYEFSLT